MLVHYVPCWPITQHIFKKQKVHRRTVPIGKIEGGAHTLNYCELLLEVKEVPGEVCFCFCFLREGILLKSLYMALGIMVI